MKTRTLCLALASLLAVNLLSARELTPSQALSRATPQLKAMSSGTATDTPELQLTLEHNGRPTVYLFSSPDNGFLVLPADDAVRAAVLAYGDGSPHSPQGTIPESMRWWLSQYSEEVAAVAAASVSEEEPGTGPVGRPEIAPLVSTLWNQTSPYNLLTPEVDGENCPTGCVATAMAQVMKKWNYPAKGTGQHSYFPGGYVTGELSVDFSSVSYDWQSMTDTYSASSPQQSIDAVATLMYSCGVAVNMSYGPNSSGSNYELASNALVSYFGYDKGIRDLSRMYFGIEDRTNLIYDELAAGRPVLYGGRNDNGGHAFVCDGYRPDGYFHFNWGWGGYSNGYFLVMALNPSDQGVGGSVGGYNLGQTIIVGIQPAVAGSEVIPVIEFMSDFDISQDSYQRIEGGRGDVLRHQLDCEQLVHHPDNNAGR